MNMRLRYIALMLVILSSLRASGQENNWTGNGPDDLWSTVSNWSLGIVPVNATTNPDSGWDDPSSPFYPLTATTADDFPRGNNYAHLNVEGTRTLIDSTQDAKAFAVRVGMNGVTNTLELTGGHLQVGGINLPETGIQRGFFLDIGRGFNETANPNPLAKVQVTGGSHDINWLLIPEQFIDPSKEDPYQTAPLHGLFQMSGGTINTHFMNLGQLVGTGRAELSGDAVINFVKRPPAELNPAGYFRFKRGWFDIAQQPIPTIADASLDIRDNAVMYIYGAPGEGITGPDETEVARYQSYVDEGWLTANGGTAAPSITLETNEGVTRIVIRAPSLPGDFNDDGKVDGRDFLAWQRGESPTALSAEDLLTWQGAYGSPLVAVSAVPEPASIALLIAMSGLLAVRRGRHSA